MVPNLSIPTPVPQLRCQVAAWTAPPGFSQGVTALRTCSPNWWSTRLLDAGHWLLSTCDFGGRWLNFVFKIEPALKNFATSAWSLRVTDKSLVTDFQGQYIITIFSHLQRSQAHSNVSLCCGSRGAHAMTMADFSDKLNGSWLIALITLLEACEFDFHASARLLGINCCALVNSCWFGYDQVSPQLDRAPPIRDKSTNDLIPRAYLPESLSPRTS